MKKKSNKIESKMTKIDMDLWDLERFIRGLPCVD